MSTDLKIIWLVFLVFVLGMAGHAGEERYLVGQKDGIKLYLRFTEPFDLENPKIVCELKNTTDNPIVYQFRGTAEGPAFEIHLYDSDGEGITKREIWAKKYETGYSMHVRFGVVPNGGGSVAQEINLREVYGDGLNQGVRLEMLWNVGDTRTGPGPFGGVFGIGSGVKGVVSIPWGNNDMKTDPASIDSTPPPDSEMSSKEPGMIRDKIISSVAGDEDALTRSRSQKQSWLLLMVFIPTLVVGIAAWLRRKRFLR